VRDAIQHGCLDERMQVEFIRDEIGEMRRARVKLDKKVLPGKVSSNHDLIIHYVCIVQAK